MAESTVPQPEPNCSEDGICFQGRLLSFLYVLLVNTAPTLIAMHIRRIMKSDSEWYGSKPMPYFTLEKVQLRLE